MIWILLSWFIAAAPSTLSSDLRMQQATNFISARSPTMWMSSHPFVTPVKTSELLNCRVQKKGMLSTGNFFPAMFSPATEPWQIASLQCSIRAWLPVYQKGQAATSPAAYTSFCEVYRKALVFIPPSAVSRPAATLVSACTPAATISTSAATACPSRFTWLPSPSLCTLLILALVITLTPFFSDSRCSTVPTFSPSTWVRGAFCPSSTVTFTSLKASLMAEAVSIPMKPPPMMVTFFTPGALSASLILVQSCLLLRVQKGTVLSPSIEGIRLLTPVAISSLSQESGSLPSMETFLLLQSMPVTVDPFSTKMPLFSRDCSLRMGPGAWPDMPLLSRDRSQGSSASLVTRQMHPLYPVFLRVSAADSPATPAPMITIFSFWFTFSRPISLQSGAELHPCLGTLTLILPSTRSTWKVLSPLKTGPLLDSPVWMEKPALWRGQRISSPTSSPLARLKPKWEHLLWMEQICPWWLITRMVSSGLGPTSSSRTSPSSRLSSVSSTASSSEKYLLVDSQVARPNPSVATATRPVTGFLRRRAGAERRVSDFRKS